jgi:hypothetical protein
VFCRAFFQEVANDAITRGRDEGKGGGSAVNLRWLNELFVRDRASVAAMRSLAFRCIRIRKGDVPYDFGSWAFAVAILSNLSTHGRFFGGPRHVLRVNDLLQALPLKPSLGQNL